MSTQGQETPKRKRWRGYEISASRIGYAVYHGGKLVAAGGVLGHGERGNLIVAREVIAKLIKGIVKPLSGDVT